MPEQQNYIEVSFKGRFMAIDYTIGLLVNGAPTTFFSIRKDYVTRIPITQPTMYLAIKSSLRDCNIEIFTEPGHNYKVELQYSRMWGSFKFKLL